MPASYRLPARLVGLTLLCAFVVAAVYGKILENRRSRPYGRFNEVQILERAQAVCAALLLPNTAVHVTAHPVERQRRDGRPHPLWFVDYADDKNDSVLRLGFDGETGDLYCAEVCPPRRVHLTHFATPGSLTAAATVLKLSREWVYVLGLAPKIGPWELTHNPQRHNGVWKVAWQCRDQTLKLSFDITTGRLLMAQVRT